MCVLDQGQPLLLYQFKRKVCMRPRGIGDIARRSKHAAAGLAS
jgi:hypothetical protein